MGDIETIFKGGGFIPMPKDDSNPGSQVEKSVPDEVKKVEDAFYRGETLRAFKRGAGIEDQQATNKEDLGKTLDEVINKRLAPLEAAIKGFGENKERAEFYKNVVEEVKATVAAGQAGRQDPLETYQKVGDILGNVVSSMKERLGIGKEVPAQPSDIPNLLALEEAKMGHDERRHQWEVEREERKHQWEIENKRWEQDYRLRVLEFSDSRKVKERAGDALDDLLGSVIDSLETERGAAATEGEAETPGTPKVRIPKSFKCKECGSIIEVAKDHDLAAPVICGSCGADYMLEEMK